MKSKFEALTGATRPEETNTVDHDALRSLIDEFGGLAGYKCKKDNGSWTEQGWDEAVMRLYRNRDLLDGIVDPDKRGKAALDAMSAQGPSDAINRLARKLQTDGD